jgi:hypothetical protein
MISDRIKNYKIHTKRKETDGMTLEIMDGLDKPDTGKYAKCLLVHIHCIAIGFFLQGCIIQESDDCTVGFDREGVF